MKSEVLSLPGLVRIEPRVFGDHRGFFFEAYERRRYGEHGVDAIFVQDNVSKSRRGTLRGLHLQHPHDQGKLVQVLVGEVYDVAVDVRRGSPTFGRWLGVYLSEENHHQLYLPPGFAHGFCVVSEWALFTYKTTDTYHPDCEVGIAWDDPDLAIDWPVEAPVVSAKDRGHPRLAELLRTDRLPRYDGS